MFSNPRRGHFKEGRGIWKRRKKLGWRSAGLINAFRLKNGLLGLIRAGQTSRRVWETGPSSVAPSGLVSMEPPLVSREPVENSGFEPLKKHPASVGRPTDEHQRNMGSKTTNCTPNGRGDSQVTPRPFPLLSPPQQAKASSTLTQGHRTTARIMRKPVALPQSGLSSSGPRGLEPVTAAPRRSHHRHHYCYCWAGAAGGDGDSPVGAVGPLSLLLARP